MLYPEGLPPSWWDVWTYTYTRSSGERRREIIRLIIDMKAIDEFIPSMVLTGDLEDYFDTYVKATKGHFRSSLNDNIRKVYISLHKDTPTNFLHDERFSKFITDKLGCKCQRIDDWSCQYSY